MRERIKMCHVPTHCYLLQFHSTVQLNCCIKLWNETVYKRRVVAHQNIAERIAKQLA